MTRILLRRSLIRTLACLSVGAAIASAGCAPKAPAASGGGPGLQPAKATTATQVVAIPIAARTIVESIEVTGALNTLNDVTVGAKIAGKIAAVYFREGDHVRAGQIVAQQ